MVGVFFFGSAGQISARAFFCLLVDIVVSRFCHKVAC